MSNGAENAATQFVHYFLEFFSNTLLPCALSSYLNETMMEISSGWNY